jgi:hypothetical protein
LQRRRQVVTHAVRRMKSNQPSTQRRLMLDGSAESWLATGRGQEVARNGGCLDDVLRVG